MIDCVLLLNCEDQSGVVHEVSRFIHESGCNIISSQQHLEELDKRFFMRVRFDITNLNCTRQDLTKNFDVIAQSLNMAYELNFSDYKKKVAIMVSKYDHCLYDLLLRHQYGEWNAEVALIVSNHKDLESVAVHFNIPYFYMPIDPDNKEAREEEIVKLMNQHQVNLVVMARYMQILTPVMLDAFPNRIINIHHGFLPAFKGAKPYHQAYEKGVKLIGATSHYANEELDMGPIIEQETIRVNHSYSVKELLRMGRDIERQVLSNAVRSHLEDKICIYKNRTIVFD
ncbi:MAG: formyltetrahydrofolate deformylase [Lentisphaeria bacterium]|nr:formyltetrahydrofolate deformylase [Lentisphaeria bacterium]NQZ68228.1 formyltetrahydrofolate deformylase [Lentisphaeria bacterium]